MKAIFSGKHRIRGQGQQIRARMSMVVVSGKGRDPALQSTTTMTMGSGNTDQS